MILAGYPRNGILLKHDNKRRLDAEFPHGRSRKGQESSWANMTGYVVDTSDAHVFIIMGIRSFLAVLSSRLPLISSPRSAVPLVGFSLFASWHGYETLTVSLVTHKSGGNIELDIKMGTMQLRHHKEYSARVSADPPAISLRHLTSLPTGREASRRTGIRSRFQDTLEHHGGDRLNCLTMKDT